MRMAFDRTRIPRPVLPAGVSRHRPAGWPCPAGSAARGGLPLPHPGKTGWTAAFYLDLNFFLDFFLVSRLHKISFQVRF